MSMTISPSARLRPSPFFASVEAEGVVSCTTYNNMILPISYGDLEAEYWRIINGVSLWDVGAERQVQIKGPDASTLAQILCSRDLSKCAIGQGKYVAVCNHHGVLLNDPIALCVDHDKWWLSVADSNIWYWASAIAQERGLSVEVSEPDVSPLAVQGPMAENVIASVFGEWVRKVRYFWFSETSVNGIPVLLARSGWSKQGGFEIYLLDGSRGTELWNVIKEAGEPWGIGPGAPNWVERIESGLLSFGGDTDIYTNPFEVRLGKYVNLDVPDDVVGISALRRIARDGPSRQQVGVVLEGGVPATPEFRWSDIFAGDEKIGDLTNCAWSLRLNKNIGFGLVSSKASIGDAVQINRAEGAVNATLVELPFI